MCDWKFICTQRSLAGLSKSIKGNAESVENYVWAATYLHNYLLFTENATYAPAGFVESKSSSGDIRDGDWQKICSADNLGFQEIKKG